MPQSFGFSQSGNILARARPGIQIAARPAKGGLGLERSRPERRALFAWPAGVSPNLPRHSVNLRVGRSDHEHESCNADCCEKSVHELQIGNKFGDIHSCCLSKQRAVLCDIIYQLYNFNGRGPSKGPLPAPGRIMRSEPCVELDSKVGLRCSRGEATKRPPEELEPSKR